MVMTVAERQRKLREKLRTQEPDKYEEKKRKHAEYMKNKRKPIDQLSETEKEKRRTQWREAKAKAKDRRNIKLTSTTEFKEKYTALLKKVTHIKDLNKNLIRQNSALRKRVNSQSQEIIRLKEIRVNLDLVIKLPKQEI